MSVCSLLLISDINNTEWTHPEITVINYCVGEGWVVLGHLSCTDTWKLLRCCQIDLPYPNLTVQEIFSIRMSNCSKPLIIPGHCRTLHIVSDWEAAKMVLMACYHHRFLDSCKKRSKSATHSINASWGQTSFCHRQQKTSTSGNMMNFDHRLSHFWRNHLTSVPFAE